MSRPSKLTQERRDRLLDLLRNGVTQEAAAWAVGIDPGTFYRWKAKGAEDDADSTYREFREAVEAARAEAEASYTMLVRRAAVGGDVRAAMWWLDRARPERWAQRQSITLDGDIAGDIEIRVPGWESNGKEGTEEG